EVGAGQVAEDRPVVAVPAEGGLVEVALAVRVVRRREVGAVGVGQARVVARVRRHGGNALVGRGGAGGVDRPGEAGRAGRAGGVPGGDRGRGRRGGGRRSADQAGGADRQAGRQPARGVGQ